MREITRTVFKFLAGFLVVLVLSALLAPWLHTFLPFKFDRILRRLIMVGTLLLVLWLVRVRRESLSGLGLQWGKESRRFLWNGFLAGLALAWAITLLQWGLGARFWRLHDTDIGHWIGFFLKGLGAGALIGTIEEAFFRGFLFVTFKDLWNKKWSLMVTNLIYALVHFFPKDKIAMGAHPTVVDSFRILVAAVTPSAEKWLDALPAMTGLFLFGLILSFVFLRWGSLFPSIGIHAGAVFTLKLNRRFLPDVSEKMNFWTGTKNLYDGLAGIALLALAAILVSRRKSLGGAR